MLFLRIKILIPLLFCMTALAFAGPESEFKTQWDRVTLKLERAASKKPFRFAAMNESLSLTARAIAAYRQAENSTETTRQDSGSVTAFYTQDTPIHRSSAQKTKDLENAEELFRQAVAKYPENSFADLWVAVIEMQRGERDPSNGRFAAFLEKKDGYGTFEKTVLNLKEFKDLTASIRSLLKMRGISVPEAEGHSVAPRWFRNFRKLEPTDRKVNILFAGVLIFGSVGLLLAHFTGSLHSKGWPRLLTGLYFSCWAGFGFWIIDLMVGLPFNLSRFRLVPWFLIVTASILVLREGFCYWKERYSPAEKGYYRCSGCGHIFPALMLECPGCRQKKRG